MKLTSAIIIIILIAISCRHDGYTPTSPIGEYEINEDIKFFYSPEKADIFELGDEVLIEYRVFSNSDVVDIQILRKTSVSYILAEDEKNDGQFVWRTDDEVKPSNHYQIKIINPSNRDVFIMSERFGLISK